MLAKIIVFIKTNKYVVSKNVVSKTRINIALYSCL